MVQQFFQCPYCWETISMFLDESITKQDYIEDCEVCCNPIQIQFIIDKAEVILFEAKSIEQ
ncbi:CPXCG motif-containing cysteine-rich protein [Hanstruepera marina]|uniref:CPXCG motif-containing cysteine-rich protein n=1 Tax=Hanstruepera marina TaxID=2873265 RepID=UPI001CA720FC|nr:CPXCG motif-containing cysteine-rich protein [Hanstruepera marina]